MNAEAFREIGDRVAGEIGRVLVGQEEVVRRVLVAVFAGGHVLLEGPPGLGKTLLVRALAWVLGCESKRIQFTPDLMPSDVTGGNVYDQHAQRFVFQAGPVFTHLLLADEINRATPKTQSALLEAMQDRSVTADGVTRPLTEPFFVLATQNPIESQGTYPLPEAQLDRFLLKLRVTAPPKAVELQILRNHAQGFDAADLDAAGLERVLDADGVRRMQRALGEVTVQDAVLEYITDIVAGTRGHRSIEQGASPRASVALLKVARAHAALDGRDFVVPDDVKQLALPALRHRVILTPDAEFEGVGPDDCIASILEGVAVPSLVN